MFETVPFDLSISLPRNRHFNISAAVGEFRGDKPCLEAKSESSQDEPVARRTFGFLRKHMHSQVRVCPSLEAARVCVRVCVCVYVWWVVYGHRTLSISSCRLWHRDVPPAAAPTLALVYVRLLCMWALSKNNEEAAHHRRAFVAAVE